MALLVGLRRHANAVYAVGRLLPNAAANVARDGYLLQRLLPVDERVGKGAAAVGTHGTRQTIATGHERLAALGAIALAMVVVVAVEVARLRVLVLIVLALGRIAVVAPLALQDAPAVGVQEIQFVEANRYTVLRFHHFVEPNGVGPLIVIAHFGEEGASGDGRGQGDNPHEQQQQPLPNLQRVDEVLHDGVGRNEQGGHQPEKEGEEHVHMDLTNGCHVPCEILRHGVRRIDGEERPEQGKHASGKQRQRQQHHKEFEDGGKELQQAVEDRLHAAALLHRSCLLRDVLHHLFCQILHVHGLALHLQLLLGRLGLGHDKGQN